MNAELTLGRRPQATVELVGPGVVWADEHPTVAVLAIANTRAAMAAGVVEGANVAVFAAHQNDSVRADVPRHPVAGFRDLAGMASIEPVPPPDAVEVSVEDLGAGVELALQRTAVHIAGLQFGNASGVVFVDRGCGGHSSASPAGNAEDPWTRLHTPTPSLPRRREPTQATVGRGLELRPPVHAQASGLADAWMGPRLRGDDDLGWINSRAGIMHLCVGSHRPGQRVGLDVGIALHRFPHAFLVAEA